jgi:uncharacterized protein (DUF2141 family)
MTRLIFCLLAVALSATAQPSFAQGASIEFLVSGVRSAEGSVRIDLCTVDTFLKDNCPYWGWARAVEGVTSVTITDVPPGVYAAQAFHDRNDNHRVDRGVLGIPREDVGFSNDAPLGLRGPAFAKAGFAHADGPQTLTLRLHHFGRRGKDNSTAAP